MILQQRIEKLISSNVREDKLDDYFQIIKENLFDASKNYHKNLIALIIVFIAFILSSAWINKPINLSFLSIEDPEIVKAIFPGLIGYIFYVLCSYASMIEHLRVVYDELAKQIFPEVGNNNLLEYLKPIYPFYSAETLIVNNTSKISFINKRYLTKAVHFINFLIVLSFEAFIVYSNYPISDKVIPYYIISSVLGIVLVLFGIFIFIKCQQIKKV